MPAIKKDYQINVINTAQHYSKELAGHFDSLEYPDISYQNCLAPKGAPNQQIGKMLLSINKVLTKKTLPDAVIVIGDTNSTLAGAIVSSKLSLPLIHIEAGARCFNLAISEEQNRVITDSLSSLLLCPTKKCSENLINSKNPGKIIFSGDLLLDLFLAKASPGLNIKSLLKKINCPSSEYGLFSLHRQENTGDKKILNQILKAIRSSELNFIFLVHPRIKDLIKTVKIPDNVICTKPLTYQETLTLQRHARLILSDSGGITREAYFAGIPVGVLRDDFEWSEILETKYNQLLGTESARIKAFIESPKKAYQGKLNLFGAGKAANNISREIKNFLN